MLSATIRNRAAHAIAYPYLELTLTDSSDRIVVRRAFAPSDYAGDLMGDLNGRRGRIAGMDTRGAMTVIKAQVPMAEMLTYEQHLTSATGGRGSYHMEFSHYEEVPSPLQAKIIAASKAERGTMQEAE